MRTPLLLLCLGLVIHGAWALTLPGPIDWDPAAAVEVARALVAGHGAVSRATWTLTLLPLAEAHHGLTPAWLHWMPLPGLVVVPGLALAGEPGTRAVSAMLGAAWAPAAWALSRALGQDARASLIAGVLAAFAGGYARFLSTPDSIALYGLLGSLAWLAVLQGRTATVAGLAAACALTRGDGFILAPCLALGVVLSARPQPSSQSRHRDALLVALTGPLAAASWWGRNWLIGGAAALEMRRSAANAVDLGGLVGPTPPALGLGARVAHLATALPGSLQTTLAVGLGILPLLALIGGWRLRTKPIIPAALAYAVLMPTLTLLAAPGVAASGTGFRSGAALFPLACALAGGAITWLAGLSQRHRGYPSSFVPGLVLLAFAIGSLGAGQKTMHAQPRSIVDCQSLDALPPGAYLLAAEPLMVAGSCDRASTVIPGQLSASQIAALIQHTQADAVWVAPAGSGSSGLTADRAAAVLPGWTDAGGGLWTRP